MSYENGYLSIHRSHGIREKPKLEKNTWAELRATGSIDPRFKYIISLTSSRQQTVSLANKLLISLAGY